MGQKLDFDDQCKSNAALKEFEEKFDINSFKKVLVYKCGKELFNLDGVNIIIEKTTYESDFRVIDIFWKESGRRDFGEQGLYINYSSCYCKVV